MSEHVPPNRPLRASEVRDDLNTVEELLSYASADDEYFEALLLNTALIAEGVMGQARTSGGFVDDTSGDGGAFSTPTQGALPLDAIGTLARDVNPQDTGPAVFQISGTVFYAVVENVDKEERQAGTSVRVVGEGNEVTARGAAGNLAGVGGAGGGDFFRYNGALYKIPRVTEKDEEVKVANQLFKRGTRTNVSADLGPGESKEFARIEPDSDSFALLKYTNATAHSTVEYNYYIDDPQDRDEDLSGPTPWATPPDLFEASPGGFKLVEDFASLELVETSGSNSYSNVQGTLTALVLEARV